MNAPHTHINNLQAARQLLLEPYGLDERHLARVLDDVMAHQVDFADLYLQSVKRERWNIEGGLIKSGSFSVDQGFGLRALDQDQSAFAYSQQINERFLMDAARAVRTIARPGVSRLKSTFNVRHPRRSMPTLIRSILWTRMPRSQS
nr:DNA gyrase modulator [Pseudomonas fluorescens]